ncbi:MAG: hypothetical protein JW963_02905, partial [Anaerolineales bacterium]|nr:hypothetical protein [Anaerolineales bacterium]
MEKPVTAKTQRSPSILIETPRAFLGDFRIFLGVPGALAVNTNNVYSAKWRGNRLAFLQAGQWPFDQTGLKHPL